MQKRTSGKKIVQMTFDLILEFSSLLIRKIVKTVLKQNV